jgi:hypothetical protein
MVEVGERGLWLRWALFAALLITSAFVSAELLYGDFALYDPATKQTGIDAFGGNAVSQRGPAISIDFDLVLVLLAVLYVSLGFSAGRWWGLVLVLVPVAVGIPLSAVAPSPDGSPSVMSGAWDFLYGTVPCVTFGIVVRKWLRRGRLWGLARSRTPSSQT